VADIVIKEADLPKVTVGENGWLSANNASFSPATSPQLCKEWAARYVAIGLYLEQQQEAAQAVTDTDKLLTEISRQVYGKAFFRCDEAQQKAVNQVAVLFQKAQKWDAQQAQAAKAAAQAAATT
jgi:hypothetical protein